MQNLKKRMVEEKDSNDKLLLSNLGMDVTYGAEIQFYHVDSKMFLTGRVLCSESDKSAYKFELSSSFGTGMIFKFMPRYKLRQEGEMIQYKDQLLIFNIKLNCFANFSISDPLEIDQETLKEVHEPTYLNHPLRRLDKSSKRFEAFLSTAADTTWQFLYHGKYEPEAWSKIKGGDLIRLRHTESGGELTADYVYQNKFTECYVRKYEGEFDDELSSVNSIWEVEIDRTYHRGDNIFIERSSEFDQSRYKLRHFLSGRLLSLGVGTLDGSSKKLPCLIEEEEVRGKMHDDSSISFISTVADDRITIDDNACYKLKVKEMFMYVDSNIEFKRDEISTRGKKNSRSDSPKGGKTLSNFDFSTTDEDFFTSLRDNELDEKRCSIFCEAEPSDENAFSVLKVSDEEMADILFVSSTFPIIRRFINILRSGAQNPLVLSPEMIRKTAQALTSLIFFVIKTDKEDPIECEGISLPKRQKIMKDMKIIEFLTEILHLPFKNKWFDIRDLRLVDAEMIKILKMSYRLVKHVIREYRPNELYASQWLDLFMKQAMLTNENSDILAEATLTELVDNNRRLLESKIKNTTIASFVELLIRPDQELNDKYVNLLRALVTCDGEPMINNQAELSRMLFENKDALKRLLLPLRKPQKDKNLVEIFVFDKWINLGDLQNCEPDGTKVHYDYFISFVNLIADLCLSRNYLAINPIEPEFPLDLCFSIISSDAYTSEMRHCFCRLIINLWIDRSPFMKIILPNKIRVWTELEENANKLICTEKNMESFESIKTFVCDYLNQVNADGFQRAYESPKNKLTEAVLRLTKIMLEFGFYKFITEINELLKPLLELLNGTRDVSNKSEESKQLELKASSSPTKRKKTYIKKNENKERITSRYEETEDNITLHKSKEVICQILVTIINIRDDRRVTNLLANFKKQMENEAEIHQGSIVRAGGQNNKSKKGIYSKLMGNDEKEEESFDLRKWMKKSINNQDLNIEGENENLVAVLLDLILYERSDLVQISFSVLNENFSQYQTMLKMLKEVQIIADVKAIDEFKSLQNLQYDLSTCSERTENWMGIDKADANAEAEKTISIIDQLSNNLTSIIEDEPMKRVVPNLVDEPDVEDIPHGNHTDHEDLASANFEGVILKPNETPNSVYQRMIRNLGHFQLVLSILKFDVESFTTKRESGQLKITLDTHFRVLRSCYRMLAKFIYFNPENQKLLEGSISIFLTHMRTLPSVGCNLVIDALFRNNRTLLSDTPLFSDLVKTIINTVDKINLDNPTKSSYIECLKIMTKYRDRIIKNNQTILMSEICSRDHQQVLLTFAERDMQQVLQKSVAEFTNNVQASHKGAVVIPNPINYLYSLLHLLSITCEEKNNATESKCQSFFPLDHLITLMRLSENCWYLRKGILFFYFHVYLDTEREMNEEQKEVDILSQIIETDLEVLSEIFNAGNGNLEIKNFKGSYTHKGLKQDYYINGLLPCISKIFEKRLHKDETERGNYVQNILERVFKISKQLDQKNVADKRIFANFIQFLLTKGFIKTENLRTKIDKEFLLPITSGGNNPSQKLLAPAISIGLNSKLKQQDDSSREARLRQQFLELEKNPKFIETMEKEFKELVDFIIEIDKNTGKIFNEKCTIGFEELAKKLILLIDVSKTSLDQSLVVVGLKLFRKIIEMENEEKTTPAADWETEDYAEAKTHIVKRQNQLVNIGFVTVLKNTIASNKSSKEVKEEAVLASISILLGGNINSQSAFYKELSRDKNNDFLVAMKDMINNSFENVKKIMSHQNKKIFDAILLKTRPELRLTEENEEESPMKLGATDLNIPQQPQSIEMARQDLEVSTEKQLPANLDEEEENEVTFLKRLFRLLQLFCEGHNLQLQNHLREQRIEGVQSGRSFDFINLTALILSNYIKFVNVYCVPLGDQILDFLIESVQGPCRENQLALCRSKIIDISKDFLAKFQRQGDYDRGGFISNEQKDAIKNLMTKSNTLLVSLIEGVVNKEIVNMLCDNLDLSFLLNRLKDAYLSLVEDLTGANKNKLKKLTSMVSFLNLNENRVQWVNEKLQSRFDEDITEAFYLYILIRTLAHENEKIAAVVKHSTDPDTEEALEFFNYHTASIELLFNGKLVRVYFPIQPICRYLSKNTRSKLMMTVSRDSPNDKIMGLVGGAPQMFDEMEHLAYLKTMPISITAKRLNKIRDLSTILAFFINFWIIYAYSIIILDSTNKAGVENGDVLPVQTIIDISGYIQIGTSVLMLLMWLIINGPLILKEKWRDAVKRNRFQFTQNKNISEEDKKNLDDIGINVSKCTLKETRNLLRLRGPEDLIFHKNNYLDFGNRFTKLEYYWLSLTYLFSDGSFNYMIFYIIISIMGSVVSEICYSLHLFDIINRFQTLKNVIKSVTYNALQLGLTLVFGLTLLYIYAMLAFYFFDDNFFIGEENTCTTLFQCYLTIINQGLRNGGGIGDVLMPMSYGVDNQSRYFVRFFYDLLFFASINIVFLNIIFGIIVDTFAELREKKNKMDEDMKNICYICNLDRYTFDRNADGFDTHIDRDHCLWNYVYFMFHLKNKDFTDYNGIESFVFEKLRQDDNSWFPLLKAMTIAEDEEVDVEQIVNQEVTNMDEKLAGLRAKVEELTVSKEK